MAEQRQKRKYVKRKKKPIPRNGELPDLFVKRVLFVAKIIGTETDDWLAIKYYLIRVLPNEYRKLLSTRHPSTLRQVPNQYDLQTMSLWEQITGVKLSIPPDKLHDPNWKPSGPPGWMLSIVRDRYNEQRRAAKQAKEANKRTDQEAVDGTTPSTS